MKLSQGVGQNSMVRLYERLLRLYPPRFRREFTGEIREVFLARMDESAAGRQFLWEMAGLAWSILQEHWHEWRTRKGDGMDTEHELSNDGGGAAVLRTVGVPNRALPWLAGWMLLPLAILPLTVFFTMPATVPYRWILNLGTAIGLWPAVSQATLTTLGLMTSLGLAVAGTQWLLLREHLPGSGRWFVATAAGFWLGGIAGVLLDLEGLVVAGAKPDWSHPFELLAIGLILGLAQWPLLHRQIAKAYWLLPLDGIAAISLLPIRIPVDYSFLLIFLPGMITGIGIWLLLRYSAAKEPLPAQATTIPRVTSNLWRRAAIGLAAAGALFLGGLWVNATILLENAKAEGAFPTLEEAIISINSRGWEEQGIKMISVNVINTSPAVVNGKQQHARWGCAEIRLDRIPPGHRQSLIQYCTQYIHTRDGWVRMGESIGSFVARVMELYNLEGLREFQAGSPR